MSETVRNKNRTYTLEEFEKEMGFSEEFLKDSRYEYNKAKWIGKTHLIKEENKELHKRIADLEKREKEAKEAACEMANGWKVYRDNIGNGTLNDQFMRAKILDGKAAKTLKKFGGE